MEGSTVANYYSHGFDLVSLQNLGDYLDYSLPKYVTQEDGMEVELK